MPANGNKDTAAPAVRSYRGGVGGATGVSTTGSNRWGLVDAVQLAVTLSAVVSVGGGLLLGATRDGSTAAVTLFYNDDRVRFYPGTDDDLHDLLKDMEFWAKLETKSRVLAWFKS